MYALNLTLPSSFYQLKAVLWLSVMFVQIKVYLPSPLSTGLTFRLTFFLFCPYFLSLLITYCLLVCLSAYLSTPISRRGASVIFVIFSSYHFLKFGTNNSLLTEWRISNSNHKRITEEAYKNYVLIHFTNVSLCVFRASKVTAKLNRCCSSQYRNSTRET